MHKTELQRAELLFFADSIRKIEKEIEKYEFWVRMFFMMDKNHKLKAPKLLQTDLKGVGEWAHTTNTKTHFILE